ncbi:MAG: NAD-dependent epimerase/dehydratase family protein [Planctomycetales bacterium]|nr:NAD-dependent epimerase/dehydratase family protein [Planctomycetales bacterium]
MRCLVTGAGGFLGEYIVEKLVARGDAVRTLARGSYAGLEKLGVEIRRGDVRDAQTVYAACEDIDCVFHTAAVAGIWGPWEHFHSINTQGTKNVIDACWHHQVPRLVFTSSPSVTFDGTDQCGVDESAEYPQKWLCHYSHTKALAEQLVIAANGQDGLLTCSLRPHLIWGPRDNHLIPRLLQRAQDGKLRIVGDGTNLVDIVYVENAADAHLLAADSLKPGSNTCGRNYFISQGEPVNCWNWINEILVRAGLKPVSKKISKEAAWRIGHGMEVVYQLLGWSSEPRMTRFLAAQLATSHYFDIQRARSDFGYVPQISTQEGMRRLVNSWSNG